MNRAYLNEVKEDYNNKTTYEDILRMGAKLKKAGHPIGIPFSQTPDANDDLIPIMDAFKAYTFDKQGNIAFAKKEIVEVLKWGASLFKDCMTDEVLSWDDSSNNRFIASGKGSMICNPISAYRTAAKDNPDVYKALEIEPPPLGAAGRVGGARTMSYGIYKFSQVQDLAKTFLYEMNAAGLEGMEASTGYNHPFLKAFLKKPMPVIGHEPKLVIRAGLQRLGEVRRLPRADDQDRHQHVRQVHPPDDVCRGRQRREVAAGGDGRRGEEAPGRGWLMAEVVLSGVEKRFGDVAAVAGVDLTVKDREFVILVGPSGCGKTTTLRMIAGLEDVSGGDISIGGKSVTHLPPRDRDIAMVFQSYALYPHMTVYRNMAFSLQLRRMPKPEIDRRVREAASILGLTELLKRKPRALSGGQRQRVAVGARSAGRPGCCSSTSRSPTSTPSSGSTCGPSSSGSTRA